MWLDENVAPCTTAHDGYDPATFSTTAQIAEWYGENEAWTISCRGPFDYMWVRIVDPQWLALAALKWGE